MPNTGYAIDTVHSTCGNPLVMMHALVYSSDPCMMTSMYEHSMMTLLMMVTCLLY